MKFFFSLFLIFSFFTDTLLANEKAKLLLRTESKAQSFLFSLFKDNNSFINSYLGGAGYEIYFADDLAFRTTLGYMTNNEINPDPLNNGYDKEESKTYLAFIPAIKYNFIKSENSSGIFGAELNVNYNSMFVKNENYIVSDPEVTTSKLGLGFSLFAGAEYFIFKNCRLSAEYKLSYNKYYEKQTIKANGKTIEKELKSNSNIDFGNQNLFFSLSFFIN